MTALGGLIGAGSPATVDQYAVEVRRESVRRQAVSALYRAAQQTQTAEEPALALTSGIDALRAVRDGTRRTHLDARRLGDVLAEADEYEWVIDGLLESRDRVILTGAEGAGKSTLTRQIAVCAAAGIHPFTQQPIPPVRVVVVDAENSERQWRRNARGLALQARARGRVDPGEALRLACVKRMDITSDRDLGSLHALLDEYDPQLLVIGPLYRLVPFAITNDDHAAPVLAALDSLRDRGPALVMEAHAGHALTRGGDRDLRPRGSSAIMAWPEFGLGLELERPDPDVPLEEQPRAAFLRRWRGDREERSWPDRVRRGGSLPWEPMSSGWRVAA
jgi:replicative DNA helicase